MVNKKIIAAITTATMAAAVITIVGNGSDNVLAKDTGRNIQASAVTEASVTATVDTTDEEATVRIDDAEVAMADSIDAAEDDGSYVVTFEGMQDTTGAAFRTEDYQAGEQIKSEDVPSYDDEAGFEGWKVSTDTSDNVYSTDQIEAMTINGDTTFTAVMGN
ncbi:MAG: hypothetical protein KBH85_04570 [Lachnospiraceae bacterium]|nr:hypothetical protein [Lachnospiraceae bacterium]